MVIPICKQTNKSNKSKVYSTVINALKWILRIHKRTIKIHKIYQNFNKIHNKSIHNKISHNKTDSYPDQYDL